jgi:protein involved in polysaccharide export with SLBB domain
LTIAQLEQTLTLRLQRAHVSEPHVVVRVKTYRHQHIFLLGQVQLPGVYTLPAQVDLKDLLMQAQGVTAEADHYLIIIRNEEQSWFGRVAPVNHMRDVPGTWVDLKQLMSGQMTTAVKLRSGDTIYVPRRLTGYALSPVECAATVWGSPACATLQAH